MVFDKVKKIIVDQLDGEEDKVTEAASITDDLGADSLDVVDLVMSFEEEFDIEIPDDQVEKIKTVGDNMRTCQAWRHRLLLRRCSRLRHYVRSYGAVSEKTQGTRYKTPPCTPLLKRGTDKELELQR